MGDLAGLRELGRWSARELGAKILLVNPLQATLPIVPQERSPYFSEQPAIPKPALSLYRGDSGAAATNIDLERLAAAPAELNKERQIDRDAVFKLKKDAALALPARDAATTSLADARNTIRGSIRIAAAVELIMPLLLYHLIVQADDEPRRHPLRNKITPLSLACNLAHQGKSDCPESDPEKGGRR